MVPAIRFEEFDGEWVESQLGKQLEISSASRVHKEEWTKEGVPFFRTSDVVARFKGTENSKAFISPKLFKKLSAKSGAVEKGDLLVTGGGSIGIAYLIDSNDPLYFKDADLLWLKNRSGISGYYLYTFFVSQPFRKYVNSISHVGTISHYTIEQAKVTPINVPTPREQTKIGEYFQELDALIAGHQKKREKLLQIKKSLLEKMFPKQGQDKPKVRFAGFDGDWKRKPLGSLGSVAMNKRVFREQTSDVGDVPFFKIGTFGGLPDAFISRELFDEYKAKYPFPEAGDLLISASGSIGRVVEYNGANQYYQDSNIVWLKHDGKIDNSFLKVFYSRVKWSGLEGSTIKRLYNKNILETLISFPSSKEQTKIGKLFKHTDTLINQHQSQIDKLNNIKQACLAQMFV